MRFRIIPLALAMLAAASCNQSDDPTPLVIPANSLSASIDGMTFYAQDIAASMPGGGLSVQGSRNSGSSKMVTVFFTLSNFAGPKTYTVDAASTASYSDMGTVYHASSGNIIVTASDDKHIAGSFSFDAVSAGGATRKITNGKFDVYK